MLRLSKKVKSTSGKFTPRVVKSLSSYISAAPDENFLNMIMLGFKALLGYLLHPGLRSGLQIDL